jgi:hypothetical protein
MKEGLYSEERKRRTLKNHKGGDSTPEKHGEQKDNREN